MKEPREILLEYKSAPTCVLRDEKEYSIDIALAKLRKWVLSHRRKHHEACFQDVIYQKNSCSCETNTWNSAIDIIAEALK